MSPQLIAFAGIALFSAGMGAVILLLLRDPDSAPRGMLARYTADLERSVDFLLLRRSAQEIMRLQLIAATVSVILAGLAADGSWLLLGVFAAAAPPLILRRRVRQRRERLEQQLDGWLLMLANMLKATGALGDAVSATVRLSPKPISEEVDLVVKEMRLGAPLDDALRGMSDRIGSPIVSAAVTGLRVGRHTGGDLPRLLERSAATLREIARVEGVVRSQTAQGRMQLVVMALLPPLIYYGLRMLDSQFFEPLQGLIGAAVYGAGVGLWLTGLWLARRILDVDV